MKSPYLLHIFESTSFDENSGPNIAVGESPIETFLQIFDEDFLLIIVNESNKYAQQQSTMLELTTEDLKAFISLLVIMGFNNLPSVYIDHINFQSKLISVIMPLKRFLKILRFLHIADNSQMQKTGEFTLTNCIR